jgi:hypothetical protein
MALHVVNPDLGDRSPTPAVVYEPRLWKARIWVPGGPFEGVGIRFKAPYGVYMNALQVLGRAAARRQITRFSVGPVSTSELRRWTKADRAALQRYEDAFEAVGREWQIDWAA